MSSLSPAAHALADNVFYPESLGSQTLSTPGPLPLTLGPERGDWLEERQNGLENAPAVLPSCSTLLTISSLALEVCIIWLSKRQS